MSVHNKIIIIIINLTHHVPTPKTTHARHDFIKEYAGKSVVNIPKTKKTDCKLSN